MSTLLLRLEASPAAESLLAGGLVKLECREQLTRSQPETEKNRQSIFDWRTKQKPSRRAGFVITKIRDSPGLIRGRLEQQPGRSLTVKAVCGGTIGWKDPPFNSILALPGATNQDPTQNEIINDFISLIIGSYNSQNNSNMYKDLKINKEKNRKVPQRIVKGAQNAVINKNYTFVASQSERNSKDTRESYVAK